jgi:hypothetical protein
MPEKVTSDRWQVASKGKIRGGVPGGSGASRHQGKSNHFYLDLLLAGLKAISYPLSAPLRLCVRFQALQKAACGRLRKLTVTYGSIFGPPRGVSLPPENRLPARRSKVCKVNQAMKTGSSRLKINDAYPINPQFRLRRVSASLFLCGEKLIENKGKPGKKLIMLSAFQIVAQVSKPAVPPISKSAGAPVLYNMRCDTTAQFFTLSATKKQILRNEPIFENS